jgi:hypothetical protein
LSGDAPGANPNWPPPESATDLSDPATWPDDHSYAYCPSAHPSCGEDEDRDGQWNYYSFIPTQSGTSLLRPEEKSSGMSIDLAWRYSIGDDSVRIAIMDSGIRWEETDLIEKVWLNAAELATHMPRHADSSPCGDAGTLVGFDCNGDGVLTVSDYAETPTLQPPAGANTVLGDANHNGVFDGGDLIHNFSDGIDDDGNGYVDDIAGWDFMKDDNDPADDTQYGHGTGEARDSVAQGNNGGGGIGGCPLCRFIPMRVGDSFIADVQAFAQGVIYATDNGARVVQSALGTINMTNFAQAALDYAYEHGVLTVASMADENSRHHNMPTTANHTLPVHAIQFRPSTRVTSVETFLDFNGCTNFGGQNLLSASGTGCSSEAVGQLSGMSGLLFSAAIKYGYADLTGAEAMQLWFNTVDDIDVPESRLPPEERNYYWSQPGFDQRFGYGRVNANRAVEWVRDGKIPPVVDIVRPYWFEVLYRDQLQGPVEILGTISATRATSYDYVVEWAPGVQPLDSAFQQIAGETNVGPEVITGSEGPITLFDVRTIDTTHEPDADSMHGENEHTITVRIRATAHYGGNAGDVPGEMRRTYAVHSDPDLVKGFPKYLGDSGEASPKMADLDGDGLLDLIVPSAGGLLHAFKVTATGPEPLRGWPFRSFPVEGLRGPGMPVTPGKPNYLQAPAYRDGHIDLELAGEAFLTPAIADVDDDGRPEVVATTWNGTIYVLEHDGTVKEGWPLRLPEVPSCPVDGTMPTGPCMGVGDFAYQAGVNAVIDRGAFGAPVLEDMNKDGKLDIIQAAFDGKVYVFELDGSPVEGWPVHPHYTGELTNEPGTGRILTTPAVVDFNGDGYPEVLAGTNEKLGGEDGQAGGMYMIDGRGMNAEQPFLPNWPVLVTSLNFFPLVAEGLPNSAVVGNFDGKLVAAFHGNASAPFLVPMDPGAQYGIGVIPQNGIPTWVDPDTGASSAGVAPTSRFGKFTKAESDVMMPLFANPSLGDIDQDGTLDVVASGSSLSVANSLLGSAAEPGQHMVGAWSGRTGEMMPGSPYLLEDFSFFNSHAIADLNGDDYPEIIAGSAGYFLHAVDGCGRQPKGWPKFTGQWIIPTPAVGDLDGDGALEVAVSTRNGWLYVWRTGGKSDGMIQWESFHHDNRNTGSFEVPLEQGDRSRRAAEPMTEAFCKTALGLDPAPAGLEPTGGCGQCAIGRSTSRNWGLGALLALALAIFRRRRPNRC